MNNAYLFTVHFISCFVIHLNKFVRQVVFLCPLVMNMQQEYQNSQNLFLHDISQTILQYHSDSKYICPFYFHFRHNFVVVYTFGPFDRKYAESIFLPNHIYFPSSLFFICGEIFQYSLPYKRTICT